VSRPRIELNLGSGNHPLHGYVNDDRFGTPDVLHDLETFPWPWETSSVDEIVLNHVLEHLGETTEKFFGVMKELYRVAAPAATIHVVVPQPNHDDFQADPTHVRRITPRGLELFSRKKNDGRPVQQQRNRAVPSLGLMLPPARSTGGDAYDALLAPAARPRPAGSP
jgi:hypothetical protein